MLLPGRMAMILPKVVAAVLGDRLQERVTTAWRTNKDIICNNKLAGQPWIDDDINMFLHQTCTSRSTLSLSDTLSYHLPQLTFDVELELDDGKMMCLGDLLAECEGENEQTVVASAMSVKEIAAGEIVVGLGRVGVYKSAD